MIFIISKINNAVCTKYGVYRDSSDCREETRMRKRKVLLVWKSNCKGSFGLAVIESVEEWGRNLDPSDVFLNEGKIPRDMMMMIGIVCAACVVSIHLVVFTYYVLVCPQNITCQHHQPISISIGFHKNTIRK